MSGDALSTEEAPLTARPGRCRRSPGKPRGCPALSSAAMQCSRLVLWCSGCDKCVSRVLISLWVSHGVERHLGVLREGPRPGPARAFQPPGLSLGLASSGSSLGSLAEQPPSPCQRESPRGGGWDGRSITEVCARMHGVGAQAFPTEAVNQGFIDFSRLLFNYR